MTGGRPIGLVTGSVPFAGLPTNPAEILLPHVAGEVHSGIEVVTVATPVDFGRLPTLLPDLVNRYRPAFVVSLGLALGAAVVRVEQMAINVAHFGVADNVGNQPLHQPHTDDAPDGMAASWDAPAIVAALLDAGVPAVGSFHAGTHLCNYTLFTMLAALKAQGRPQVPCGFFHLPYLPEQIVRMMRDRGATPQKAPLAPVDLPSMSLELQITAVTAMLAVVARQAVARGTDQTAALTKPDTQEIAHAQ